MTYYLIEISMGDSSIAGKAVYTFGTKREALAAYHKKVGTAMGSDLYTSDMAMVIDGEGNYIARNYYVNDSE